MVNGTYQHFKGKWYVAQGEAVFSPVNGDPIVDIAFDADDVSRQAYVYLGKDGVYVLEDAGECVHEEGLVCMLYRGQYTDKKLGEKPLFFRKKEEFFSRVDQDGYRGPRFIKLAD